jgi:hypothetical protein
MRFPPPRHASKLLANALIALFKRRRHPICPNHVASIGGGFSRALSHELQHSWKQTRARASRPIVRQIPVDRPNEIEIEGRRGKIPLACPNFMSSKFFARIFQKIGRPLSASFVGHC